MVVRDVIVVVVGGVMFLGSFLAFGLCWEVEGDGHGDGGSDDSVCDGGLLL